VCTVSYLPLGNNEFLLTSNRDETPKRQPQELFLDENKGLLYPKEPNHGGTWICVSSDNRVLCLLNGAFEKHKHEPPYKKSRGLVVLDFFEYKNAPDFFDNYAFDKIEPFTMVLFDQGKLYDFRWDGLQKHIKPLDASKPHIWSSSTLYPQAIKNLRQQWFDEWAAKQNGFNSEAILHFHENAGADDIENDLIMNRNNGIVCTVSITHVVKRNSNIEIIYKDRIHQHVITSSLQLSSQGS